MEFYEAINRRRTVRAWRDTPVPEETVNRILDAGLRAPSNNHLREWEFILLRTGEEKEHALRYVKEWVCRPEKFNPAVPGTEAAAMYDYATPRQYSMLRDAPVVVLPLFKSNGHILQPEALNHLNPFASAWCVVENIFLAAAAEGLACSVRIPVGEESANVCRLLNVPGPYMLPCYIGIGVPAEESAGFEQNVFHAADKLHYGTW